MVKRAAKLGRKKNSSEKQKAMSCTQDKCFQSFSHANPNLSAIIVGIAKISHAYIHIQIITRGKEAKYAFTAYTIAVVFFFSSPTRNKKREEKKN